MEAKVKSAGIVERLALVIIIMYASYHILSPIVHVCYTLLQP